MPRILGRRRQQVTEHEGHCVMMSFRTDGLNHLGINSEGCDAAVNITQMTYGYRHNIAVEKLKGKKLP